VTELKALTREQLARAEQRLRHPAPGGRIAAAREYGIDMTLLIEQLRLTPAERARKPESASTAVGRLRGGCAQAFLMQFESGPLHSMEVPAWWQDSRLSIRGQESGG
jgi:hypothetical protein